MLVLITPPDLELRTWRIEMWPDGSALVWEMAGPWVSSSPVRGVRTVGELGGVAGGAGPGPGGFTGSVNARAARPLPVGPLPSVEPPPARGACC